MSMRFVLILLLYLLPLIEETYITSLHNEVWENVCAVPDTYHLFVLSTYNGKFSFLFILTKIL